MSDSNRWKWGIFSWYGGCTSCLLLLAVTLGAERGMGGEETERETEGGEESEKEWTLQSDLKFIFNQASSSQTTTLLGAKRHNFTETNLKTGLESAGGRQLYRKQTNKPHNLTVTLEKSNFYGLNLVPLWSTNQLPTSVLQWNLYLIDKVMSYSAAVMKGLLL